MPAIYSRLKRHRQLMIRLEKKGIHNKGFCDNRDGKFILAKVCLEMKREQRH